VRGTGRVLAPTLEEPCLHVERSVGGGHAAQSRSCIHDRRSPPVRFRLEGNLAQGAGHAVAARAAVIVTSDEDLPVIGRYNGIDIVSPREFLSRLST
jgi:hypothetical protein